MSTLQKNTNKLKNLTGPAASYEKKESLGNFTLTYHINRLMSLFIRFIKVDVKEIGVAYEIVESDNSKILHVTESVTITLPDNLEDGVNITIVNVGVSKTVTISATTLNATASTIVTQYGSATFYKHGSAWFGVGT